MNTTSAKLILLAGLGFLGGMAPRALPTTGSEDHLHLQRSG